MGNHSRGDADQPTVIALSSPSSPECKPPARSPHRRRYTPDIPGLGSFAGTAVHTQDWPKGGIDYHGKNVVVIGSGATAVTVIPEIAKTAGRTTMLQRSPTYINGERSWEIQPWALSRLLISLSPTYEYLYYQLARVSFVNLTLFWFTMCKRYPKLFSELFLKEVRQRVGKDNMAHFTPSYSIWEQRVCFSPDGEFHAALLDGRLDIVTDHIDAVTPTGIKLRSGGDELPADVIVLATGLNMVFGGKIKTTVDGTEPVAGEQVIYKGMMISDIPNMFFLSG